MPDYSDTRWLRIIAQDPSVQHQTGRKSRNILTVRLEIPVEDLRAGPWGYRVQVIDYDASSRTAYKPFGSLSVSALDRYEAASDSLLLNDPRFHCQNV